MIFPPPRRTPSPLRAYERAKIGRGEGRARIEREGRLVVCRCNTRRPRWNRMVAFTQLRRVSVYTAQWWAVNIKDTLAS